MSEGEDNEVGRTEFLNGGVVVRDLNQDAPVLNVEHICVGCGETIRTFEVFEDRAEESLDVKPMHDSVRCKQKADNLRESEVSGDV